jgi:hypothetical protein
MEYKENKTRYLLLPDLYDDGECKMVDVMHIRAIEKLDAEDYETVDSETGEIVRGRNEERCIVTICHESTYMKDWREKSHDILVPLSMFELLKLINSDAEYVI